MVSIDHKRLRIVKGVAVVDLCLAFIILSYATFQFSHGESLIPWQMSSKEKLTRLIIYGTLNYIFLLIQILMAISLFRSTSQVMDHPVMSLQRFKTWRAWSSVYMVVIFVDIFFVSLMLVQGQGGAENGNRGARERRIISLVLLIGQIIFRPMGILLVKKMENLLSHDMSGVFKNQRSIVHDPS